MCFFFKEILVKSYSEIQKVNDAATSKYLYVGS